MKKFLVALVLVLLVASSASAAIRWRGVTHVMPGTEQQRIVEQFAETVERLSGGELIIEPFAAGVLFPVSETFDNVAMGVVQVSFVYSGWWMGRDPAFALTSRLGCPVQTWSEGAYIEERLSFFYEALYERFGMRYLGHLISTSVPEQILSVVPINTLEDLRGLRFRAAGFPTRLYAELGANVVSIAAPEIYTALQTRLIDALEYTMWAEHTHMNLQEVTSYVVDSGLHVGPRENLPLVVNKAAWDALPEHLQYIVLVARDRARYQAAMVHIAEMRAREIWRANPNITITRFSPEEEATKRAIAQRIFMEFTKEIEGGQELLEVYRTILWELGYHEDAKNLGFVPEE